MKKRMSEIAMNHEVARELTNEISDIVYEIAEALGKVMENREINVILNSIGLYHAECIAVHICQYADKELEEAASHHAEVLKKNSINFATQNKKKRAKE